MITATNLVEDRIWLEKLLYYMMEQEQLDYCYTFHNMETLATREPFATIGMMPVPMAVQVDDTDRLRLLCYYPMFEKVPFKAQLAMLRHEAIHIIDGHVGTIGLELREQYGQLLANMAMDVYVNQKIDIQPLLDCGFRPLTIELFGLPPDLSSREYAELLSQNKKAQEFLEQAERTGGIRVIVQSVDGRGNADKADNGDGGRNGNDGDNAADIGEQPQFTEVFDVSKKDAARIDNAVQSIRKSVEDVLQSKGKEWGRGFCGADYKESVEALQRQSTVPWYYYIRMAETAARADIVTPTRRRLSRRHETHLGRIRRYGLEVAFMIDTSGSMGSDELSLVDAELRGLHTRGAHIMVIHSDAAVAQIHEYSPYQPLTEFYGRGGTDFSEALLAVRQLPIRPGLFIGYTDGYGGVEMYVERVQQERGAAWYDAYVAQHPRANPDGIDTLWLLPEDAMEPEEFTRDIVPWGDVVVVPKPKHGKVVTNGRQDQGQVA